LVAADLHTGRTHQIRAHFAAIGHPLVGDTLYGAALRPRAGSIQLPPLGRVFLHAASLAFTAPRDGRSVTVQSPLDPSLKAYLDAIAAALRVAPREVDASLRPYL
jgi:23S rRNA-/tRNA-specific pseudouridylate synthase